MPKTAHRNCLLILISSYDDNMLKKVKPIQSLEFSRIETIKFSILIVQRISLKDLKTFGWNSLATKVFRKLTNFCFLRLSEQFTWPSLRNLYQIKDLLILNIKLFRIINKRKPKKQRWILPNEIMYKKFIQQSTMQKKRVAFSRTHWEYQKIGSNWFTSTFGGKTQEQLF